MPEILELAVEQGDIAQFTADVIAFKYAQGFHGADRQIAQLLTEAETPLAQLQPSEGQHALVAVPSLAPIAAKQVLFVGVPSLRDFGYPQIRAFSSTVLGIVKREAPVAVHLAMIIHGPGYGLDETEAFLSVVEGILDELRHGDVSGHLARLTIVDRNRGRVQRLRDALSLRLDTAEYATRLPNGGFRLALPIMPATATNVDQTSSGADSAPQDKPHVFVAMSFSTHLDDVFYFGIQTPVHNAGYLCVRIDKAAFAGGIVETIKERIDTAAVVIAEISDRNPNVFLEIGYAWGRRRPTILLATSVDGLPFDVTGHRCLTYQGIRDLEGSLTRELAALKAQGRI